MLSLDDRRWSNLRHAYGKNRKVVEWIRKLRAASPQKLGTVLDEYDYWGALCHQYTVYPATYATIPHLTVVAESLQPEFSDRINLLVFIGTCAACAHLPRADPIPKFLQRDYERALKATVSLVAASLPHAMDNSEQAPELRHLLSAMAALKGFAALAFIIADLDCSIECPSCQAFVEPFESSLNLLMDRKR